VEAVWKRVRPEVAGRWDESALSALHGRDQRRHADDGDGAPQIVGQHAQAHLAGDVFQPSGLEGVAPIQALIVP
jgi:hypothetical protein